MCKSATNRNSLFARSADCRGENHARQVALHINGTLAAIKIKICGTK